MATNFGWLPPSERNNEQNKVHDEIMASMPMFKIVGNTSEENLSEAKAYLWDCVKVSNGGQHFNPIVQVTGSCVGAGGGHALWNLQAVEVVRLGDNEEVKYPFWLLPYGKSREIGGLNGQGEGSFGSAFAEAIRRFGTLPADTSGLPSFAQSANGRSYTQAVELQWSNGRAIASNWLQQSSKFVVKSTAKLRSTDDVRAALLNYYPLTIASMWGGNMLCSVQGSGENRRLINRRTTEWAHQMACIGYENNPQHGHLYYIMNSWGANTHGICPSGAPPGGFWIREEDMQFMLRSDEVFAFSQFDGFPGQKAEIDKKLFKIVGS